jgi:hypothetical protein
MKFRWLRIHGNKNSLALHIKTDMGTWARTIYKVERTRGGWHAHARTVEMLFQGEGARTMAKLWVESQYVMR